MDQRRLRIRPFAILIACFFAMAVSFSTGAELRAVDLTKVPRTIVKEPVYSSKAPGYCLLVFGREARSRVWLVVDRRRLYIDRNGNGDLTEPGELIKSNSIGRSFEVDQIRAAGGFTHKDFELSVDNHDRFSCSIDLASGRGQSVGGTHPKPRLAARPQDAPIIHFDGPTTFARYRPIAFLTRRPNDSRDRTIRVVVGSRGLGEGTFAAYHCGEWLGDDKFRMVTADLEFPGRISGADPITRRDHLKLLE